MIQKPTEVWLPALITYLDLPNGGKRENETATDRDGVNDVDDDEEIPQAPSIVRGQKRV